jgi:hypothetical protein
MNLIKELPGVLKFSAERDELIILVDNQGTRSIRKLDSDLNETWRVENHYYSFQILGEKIYLTTTGSDQHTEVIDQYDGNVLTDRFKITFHFDGHFKTKNEFLCVATLNEKKVYVLFNIRNEEVLEVHVPPLGINNVYKLVGEEYYLSTKKAHVNLYRSFESSPVWEFQIDHFLSSLIQIGHKQIDNTKKTIVLKIDDLSKMDSHLIGLDLQSGNAKWHYQGYSNFELHGGKLYNLEFHGRYRVLNADTGEVLQDVDLKDEFERRNINCEHRFTVTDTHIFFKHAIQGKFGILNLETLKIGEVQQIPAGNTLSTEEYLVPIDNRLYVRSSPQNNLFIYQLDLGI